MNGLACAHIIVLTRALLSARGWAFEHPYLSLIERADGEVEPVASTSIASVANLLQALAPETGFDLCSHDSDDRDMLLAVLNGAAALH